MSGSDLEQQLTSDLRSKLAEALKKEPGLTPEAAMVKITKEMLQNNPFVPPEGDNRPINKLPGELLAYLFETGMQMEIEAKQFGDDEDDDDEFEEDLSDDDEENDEEIDGEVVDLTKGGDDDEEWSDVDEEGAARKRKRNGKARKDDEDDEDDEDYEEFDEDEDERELPFQVLVSHVCKRWRSVALDTPALWTLLHLDKSASLGKHRAYLERAKNAPLDIIIDCTYDDPSDGDEDDDEDIMEERNAKRELLDRELVQCLRKSVDRSDTSLPDLLDDPNWHTRPGTDGLGPPTTSDVDAALCEGYYSISELSEILDLIVPRVQHWRALSVAVTDYRWMYLFLARLHQCGPAETLEIVELYHYDDNDTGEVFHPRHLATKFTPFHGQAPRLQHAVFWGVHLDWDASLGLLKSVEDVEMAYHMEEVRPSYQTFEIITKSPSLKNLSLSLSGPRGTEDGWRNSGIEPIRLSTLQGLTLRYHPMQYARSLLRFLDTPAVKSLVLDFDEDDYTEFAKDLCKAPFGRSKTLLAGLENFKLSGLPCSRMMVERMLDELANLKSLNLNCTGEGEQFFEALLKATTGSGAGSSGKKVLCPQLEAITTAGITGSQMKEFVAARVKAGLKLKKVYMSEEDDVEVGEERWLKEHVQEFEFFSPSDSEEEFDDEEMDEMDLFAH